MHFSTYIDFNISSLLQRTNDEKKNNFVRKYFWGVNYLGYPLDSLVSCIYLRFQNDTSTSITKTAISNSNLFSFRNFIKKTKMQKSWK